MLSSSLLHPYSPLPCTGGKCWSRAKPVLDATERGGGTGGFRRQVPRIHRGIASRPTPTQQTLTMAYPKYESDSDRARTSRERGMGGRGTERKYQEVHNPFSRQDNNEEKTNKLSNIALNRYRRRGDDVPPASSRQDDIQYGHSRLTSSDGRISQSFW